MTLQLIRELVARYPLFLRKLRARSEYEWRWQFPFEDGWFDLLDKACIGIESECRYALEKQGQSIPNLPYFAGAMRTHWELVLKVRNSTENSRCVTEIVRSAAHSVCERCGAHTSAYSVRGSSFCEDCTQRRRDGR